jgi:hypothetical protein
MRDETEAIIGDISLREKDHLARCESAGILSLILQAWYPVYIPVE